MTDVVIRSATTADAQPINDILNHYVEHSTATFITVPQTLDERLAWLEGRSEEHPVIVAELSGSVVGWASLSSFRVRAAYAHTVELGVYVHYGHHRRGIGRDLVSESIRRAKEAGHHVIVGGCCHESAASITLLESFGFVHVGYFREVGQKFGRWLDVDFLQLML